MTIPVSVFTGLIFAALALVVVAPLILLVLLLRDWRGGNLW
jgi:hypothetical protein